MQLCSCYTRRYCLHQDFPPTSVFPLLCLLNRTHPTPPILKLPSAIRFKFDQLHHEHLKPSSPATDQPCCQNKPCCNDGTMCEMTVGTGQGFFTEKKSNTSPQTLLVSSSSKSELSESSLNGSLHISDSPNSSST